MYISRFLPGDIIVIRFTLMGFFYDVKGLCISIRGRSLTSKNSSITLRNFISKVAVEWTISIYLVVVLVFDVSQFQRKRIGYRASRLFYLRNKVNKESLVF